MKEINDFREGFLTISETINLLNKEGFDVTPQQLRKYELAGLIIPEKKTSSKYRLYSDRNLDDLREILALRLINFSIKKIKKFISLSKKINQFRETYCYYDKKEKVKKMQIHGLILKDVPITQGFFDLDNTKFDFNKEGDRLNLRRVLLESEELKDLLHEAGDKTEKFHKIFGNFMEFFFGSESDADRLSDIIRKMLGRIL